MPPFRNHPFILYSLLGKGWLKMKKIFSLFAAALIALGAALPVSQVALAEDPPPEDPPMLMTVYACSGDDCPEGIIEDTVEYSFDGGSVENTNPEWDPMLAIELECSTEACNTTWDIYYEIKGTFDWEIDGNYPHNGTPAQVNIDGTEFHFYCGSGFSGHCDFLLSGVLSRTEDPDTWDVYIKWWSAGINPFVTFTSNLDFDITLSSEPIDNCGDYADQEDISSGSLNPTSEDGALITLETGRQYRVNIFGGPWNDGSYDRYDAAVKNGEDAWMAVGGFIAEEDGPVECSEPGADDVTGVSFVITAQDTNFRIRVNDIVGQFANNTGSLDYSVTSVLNEGNLPTCEDYFMLNGDPIYSNTIMASNSTGEVAWTKTMNGHPAVGEYIAITFTDTWQNNGAGAELQDMAMKIGTGGWVPLATTDAYICDSVTGEEEPISTIYLQVTSPMTHYFRMDDTDGVWGSNSGSVSYTVSMVIYTPPAASCAGEYELAEYIGSRTALATSDSGVEYSFNFSGVPTNPNGTGDDPLVFAVETYGFYMDDGMVGVSGGMAVDTGVGGGLSPEFEPLETYSNALCIEMIDPPMGHVRVYFAVDPLNNDYLFRVEDDDYAGNTGDLEFRFYKADYLRVDDPPVGDPCGLDYQKGPLVTTYTISATTPWLFLDVLQDGQFYALETSGGPWLDDGDDNYFVDIGWSTDGVPNNFTELTEFALCTQEAGDNHYTGFMYKMSGWEYFTRVHDSLLGLLDNSGSIQLKVYSATHDGSTWETCADAYSMVERATDPLKTVVPANKSAGAKVEYISPGYTYGIEINGDNAWSDPDEEGSYLAAICLAGVAGCVEWVPLSEAEEAGIVDCVVAIDTTKPTYRAYFNVNSPLYLRVLDTDGNFTENSGKLTYKVFGAGPNGPIDYPDPDGTIDEWEVSCYSSCARPDGLFTTLSVSLGTIGTVNLPLPNVGGWISYGTCSVVSYITWCPEHTEILKNIGRTISDEVEPIATMNDLVDFVGQAKAQFDAIQPYINSESMFSYNPNGGGATQSMADINGNPIAAPNVNASMPIELLLGDEMDITANNPWFGGNIELQITNEADPDRAAYLAACVDGGITLSVGEGAATAYCQFIYLVRNSKFFIALITIMDIVIIGFIVFKYLPWNVRRFFALLDNNRRSVSTIMEGR